MASSTGVGDGGFPTLESVRKSLVRQEDTIVFCLIERAKFPTNSPLYDEQSSPSSPASRVPMWSGSLFEYIVRETEALQSKVGRYKSPEENPFFPNDIPSPLVPSREHTQLLPLLAVEGDDGNYVPTAAADIHCLQALSRRIHYGKFVAEVKFREAPHDYTPAIIAQDREALMKLLTFEAVEEMVKKRVEKKGMEFSKEVTVNGGGAVSNCKIDPSLLSRLYGEWVIPLTKLVEVEYLLRRLD
ncbi:unnamed protein product [Cuscuta campestris]|uniref:chorismate mutase n=1 Tax=Cuscuta campestris TaxID=132261 RepID=A0A484NMZ7_9ASTE|nr:unnamed protein product [Cuscuta campestris]